MPVYLDHNATSPLHPEVADAIMPFLRNPPGNPFRLQDVEALIAKLQELVNKLPAVIRQVAV